MGDRRPQLPRHLAAQGLPRHLPVAPIPRKRRAAAGRPPDDPFPGQRPAVRARLPPWAAGRGGFQTAMSSDSMKERLWIALLIPAAAWALVLVHRGEPLAWDEIEFYRATRWIAE